MKKKGLLCAALLLTGCFGGMETITRQDVQEGATQQEWAAVEEMQDTKMVVNDLSGSIESWNRIIDEQGEGIVDLYLPVGQEGQLETRVAYEIHSSDGAASIDGVFLVSVDEQIVPSSIKGGTKQQVHFVKVPLQEAVVDVQVDLSEIDLSYNHGITFHFLYRDENGCSDLSVSKFIGDEENRSYMEYFETLAYPGTVSDDDMQEAIDLYQSNDTSFMLSNVWNYLYTPIFNRGAVCSWRMPMFRCFSRQMPKVLTFLLRMLRRLQSYPERAAVCGHWNFGTKSSLKKGVRVHF